MFQWLPDNWRHDWTVRVRDLKTEIERGDDICLIDVRRPDEHALCALPGSLLMPLHELPHRLRDLDPRRNTVVYCHVGIRSAEATRMLQNCGFTRVRNLVGGIDAWSLEIDPRLPRY